MNRVWLIVIVLGVLLVAIGAVFLYSWDIPAPQQRVEQELSNDPSSR